MPKRKRSSSANLLQKLEKYEHEVFRELKVAKGHVRQRLGKRQHEKGVTEEKQQKLEREITVLKSLDLHQTARAHLVSSILRVKSIADSPDLPEEIRAAVPKPDLPDDDKAVLHNVTSALYNHKPVRDVIDKAIKTVCESLDLPIPVKGKQSKKGKRETQEDQPSDRINGVSSANVSSAAEQADEEPDSDVTDFEGFDDDDGDDGEPENTAEAEDADTEEEEEEEAALSKYDDLLGSSSDEDDEDAEDLIGKSRGREQVNLDDISISSGSESDVDETASQDSEPSPPPTKKTKTKSKPVEAPPQNTTFLSTLMSGYVSGSESASDVDVAPPKKRRGQKARQAIWEKKYGSGAKHLSKPATDANKSGRDSGWDMRRGAVDGDDQSRRTPWKKGVVNPLEKKKTAPSQSGAAPAQQPKERKIPRKDDEGPLHPSWEARKKAKNTMKNVAFAGQKVVFD